MIVNLVKKISEDEKYYHTLEETFKMMIGLIREHFEKREFAAAESHYGDMEKLSCDLILYKGRIEALKEVLAEIEKKR